MAIMHASLFDRPLTAEEPVALDAGLHADVGLTVRRYHMLVVGAAGHTTPTIARTLSYNEQTVRLETGQPPDDRPRPAVRRKTGATGDPPS